MRIARYGLGNRLYTRGHLPRYDAGHLDCMVFHDSQQ